MSGTALLREHANRLSEYMKTDSNHQIYLNIQRPGITLKSTSSGIR